MICLEPANKKGIKQFMVKDWEFITTRV
jgi:hypothetical protein